MLVGLDVSIFSVLEACVSALLGFPFSPMPCKQLVLQEVSGDGIFPVADLASVDCPAGCYFSNVLLLLDLECPAELVLNALLLPVQIPYWWCQFSNDLMIWRLLGSGSQSSSGPDALLLPFSREYQEV